jgi:histidinol-phosphate/aromatic aminotransferase/cobyric acid decarboxylase-like protein/adenosyl cobinamide kinase/adenosyl cobinamide phosphate guanylyltransferase
MAELILVVGGTRSGKSALAERLVAGAPSVTYVATMRVPEGDAELAGRVALHRARRPAAWHTVEAQDDLAAAVAAAPPGSAMLVDGLGAWLADRMGAAGLFEGDSAEARAAIRAGAGALVEAAARHQGGPVVVVAEEAGLGVVPAGAGTRRWLDLHGEVVQTLAAGARRVLLVVAGRAIELPAAGSDQAGAGTRVAPPAVALDEADPALAAHGDTMVPPGALDLAVNVHGEAPPAHVRAALDAALDRAGAYPDAGPARVAVAKASGRPEDEVLLTAGASEAFWLLARALHVRLAAIVTPQYTEPEAALRASGSPVVHVPRDPGAGWALDPAAIPDEADLVVLGNPNNPTGTLDDPDRIAAVCRPGRVTLVDEAFMSFVADPAASVLARRDLPGLVVTRSVTKLWALPGVRAGWLAGPPGIVARCAAGRPAWPLGTLELAALELCADDEPHRLGVAADVAAERTRLTAALRGLPGVQVAEGAANFVLLRVPDGPRVHAELLRRGIAVRPPTFPGLDAHHLRVAVRDTATTTALATALAEIMEERA